jgi:hypothetical protein
MREIKYQGWNGKILQQVRRIHFDSDGTVWWSPNTKSNPMYNSCYYSMRQFTGLLGNNGKEIYEGDIVRYETDDGDVIRAEVIFENAEESKYLSGFTTTNFQDVTDEIYDEDCRAPEGWTGEIEVIGNRFENPELLKISSKHNTQLNKKIHELEREVTYLKNIFKA